MPRYYISLPRYSSGESYIGLPNEVRTTYEDTPLVASQWMFSLLRRTIEYYTQIHTDPFVQHLRRQMAHKINTVIKFLEEEEICHHYGFMKRSADIGFAAINAETFEPDREYWNYFNFQFRLYVHDDDVVKVRLYCPDIKIEIEP